MDEDLQYNHVYQDLLKKVNYDQVAELKQIWVMLIDTGRNSWPVEAFITCIF